MSLDRNSVSFIHAAVLHRCHAAGHGAGASRDREWNPVCAAEQYQPEVWAHLAIAASYDLTHLIKARRPDHLIHTNARSQCLPLTPSSHPEVRLKTRPLCFPRSLEVGSCIAVQVCMIQIPLLILFNAFYVSARFFGRRMQSWWNRGSNDSRLSCPGCWIHARVQWHPPLVQHLQCHSGQLHFHGWEVWLLSGWVMTPDFQTHRNNRRIVLKAWFPFFVPINVLGVTQRS